MADFLVTFTSRETGNSFKRIEVEGRYYADAAKRAAKKLSLPDNWKVKYRVSVNLKYPEQVGRKPLW